MRVFVNGEPTELGEDATLAAVVETLDLPGSGRGLAIAVDAEVVPRGDWPSRRLGEGARVEILHAIQGG